MSLPSADDFYSIFLATLPVSALPADRKTTLAQWRPLQAQLIVLKELRVLKNTEETMMFYLCSPQKKTLFQRFFFFLKKVRLCTFSIELRWTVAEPGRSTFT